MPFSIRCGPTLLCLTMLPFLCLTMMPKVIPGLPEIRASPLGPAPNCCMATSKGKFNERVTACFEQKENTIRGCGVHAYIFHTENNNVWCVDPEAPWIPDRLKKLEQRGKRCQVI